MHRLLVIPLLAAFAATMASPAQACFAPSQPSCVPGAPNTSVLCGGSHATYEAELRNYHDCLRDRAEAAERRVRALAAEAEDKRRRDCHSARNWPCY